MQRLSLPADLTSTEGIDVNKQERVYITGIGWVVRRGNSYALEGKR
ncbi:hypothetical protein PBI_IRONMAN_91 [Mycobacterium phage IronMan]|uniref:Uncharacterized protein n=1 Tax=Mycobacterium phage IronMan TaxID=2499042 RepID=A0A3S9UDD3_9CAUD|nr:hypothetical protein KI247_gp10 [Mycobacterium phage IronMan]AZS08291.1 hypothetical protein PBI_IRONMAN_91 [Mycobacterium phage IronMan]